MTKILITGPKTYIEPVISKLHDEKILHIVDHVPEDDIDIGKPLEKADMLSEILVRIRSVSSYLNIDSESKVKDYKPKNGYKSLDLVSRNLQSKVNEIKDKLKDVEVRLDKNNEKLKLLKELDSLDISAEAFSEFNTIKTVVGYVKDTEKLDEKIKDVTTNFEFFSSAEKKGLMAVAFEKKYEENISELLKQSDLVELDISGIKDLKGDIKSNIAKFQEDNFSLSKEKDSLKSSLEKTKDEWQPYLIFSEIYLNKELEKMEVPLRFASTKNIFVIKGWVPSERLDDIKEKLKKETDDKIDIKVDYIEKKDNVPVKLNNARPVKPFEFLLDLYTLPNYKEFDPTFFIFLVFPLLFGFMLGDFGYGIITLLLVLPLKKKIPQAKAFFNIFIYSSLSTIFFGLLFGEFMGYEELWGYAIPHVVSRAHAIDILISVSILVGVIHLLAGFIIGFFNVYKAHGLKHAIVEKVGWMLLFPGITRLLVILSLVKGDIGEGVSSILPPDMILIILAVIGVILIIKGEGINGAVELPGLFSNIVSYVRLMAIGLASVMLAIVVNDIAGEMFSSGSIGMMIAGILILIIGHTINIAIGWLGCFLQSLRLHYVEFFPKFFKGGGTSYKPFGEE